MLYRNYLPMFITEMGRQILDKTMYFGNLKFFSWMSTKTPNITKIAADQTNMTVFTSIISKKREN